jgi:apolipoprotein N-acyltransferase
MAAVNGRISLAIGAALVTAVTLWAASPAVGAGWLAWIALVPAAVVVLRAPRTRAARLAIPLAYALYLELLFVPALPFGLAEGQWGQAALPVLVGGSPVLPVALVAIPLFGALLYLIRFGQPWGAELLGRRCFALAAVLVPASAWTGLDLLRAKLEPGGSFGPLYLSQVDAPAADLAALGGPWLLTLAIVGFNYGLALALVRRRAAPALATVAAIAATLAAATAVESTSSPGRTLTVAAVQPGYDTSEDERRRQLRSWDEGTFNLAARDLIRDLGALTSRAARDGADLVVWPEAVAFVDLRERDGARAALLRVARRSDVAIVAPYFDHGSRTGAAFAASPRGAVTAARPKQRPMWFLGEEDAASKGPRPVNAAGTRVGTLLGVDVQDPNLPRQLVARDAELLTSSTHDWRQLTPQHRALAALGAEAAGSPLVRADWRYGSAIYARDGEVLADAGEHRRRTVLTAAVETASSSVYASIGDVVGWVSLAAALAAGVGAAIRRRSATRAGGPAFGGRAPRRGASRRPPSPAPPPAGAGPSPPPP